MYYIVFVHKFICKNVKVLKFVEKLFQGLISRFGDCRKFTTFYDV